MLLKIDGLTKRFDGETVINDLNYSIEGKFFLTILGSSGCGKTTLLRILSGVLKPDGGTAYLSSERLAFVFQDDRLIPWITAGENIDIVSPGCDVNRYLRLVGLEGHGGKYPSQMSGGMKRRLNIARAIAFDPDLILMDEPFNSLDVVMKDRLLEEIKEIWHDRKLSIVMVTHDPREAARLSTEIMLVRDGFGKTEIVNLGNPMDRSADDIDAISRRLLERMKEFSSYVQ
jgi:NitT/TauT family transport system ATP-binding protein